MKHFSWLSALLCAVAFAPVGQSVAADANARSHDQEPSVLATVTQLKKGSLPQTVNAFGTIETGPEGKRTMMAPTSAIVDDIYVRSGEEVRNGAPLIRLGPSPGTAASYAKAQSSLSAAKALVQRVQDLLDQHLATRQQLADAKNSAADAKATITALEAEGAARPRTLRSPFDAIITSVPATLGALVSQGTPLLALARPDVLVLTAGVIPDNASKIQVGQEVKVSSLGGDHAVAGKVTFREAVVDPKTGLVPIEVSLPPDSFIPGQSAEAEIQVGRIQGYIVPHGAVLVNDKGSPYVVQSKHLIARKVPVEILLHAGDRDVVSGALDPQSPLVLAGNYQLQEGSRLRVAEPGTAASQ